MDRVLGIDFGTSCTSAGVLLDDRVALVQDGGDDVIPTVVHVPAHGSYEVGRRAQIKMMSDPTSVVRSVKRLLGLRATDEALRRFAAGSPFAIDTRTDRVMLKLRAGDHAPEQIAAVVLDHVRRLAETRFGGVFTKAVITTMAKPPVGYRDAITRAARIAHLDVLELVPEPIAGALGVGLHARAADRKLVVCDFGGGTFDVSALVQSGLKFTTVECHGDALLGGDDLDDAMAEALAASVFRKSGYDMHRDAVRWNELLLRCESAKRQLSTHPDVRLHMREAYLADRRRHDLDVPLDRGWAEACWEAILARAVRTIRAALARAGWKPHDVDEVALIGGGAQIPALQRAIRELFVDRPVIVPPRADVSVALGAVLLTARFSSAQRSVPVLARAAAS